MDFMICDWMIWNKRQFK